MRAASFFNRLKPDQESFRKLDDFPDSLASLHVETEKPSRSAIHAMSCRQSLSYLALVQEVVLISRLSNCGKKALGGLSAGRRVGL
jgi:hypothetical protein